MADTAPFTYTPDQKSEVIHAIVQDYKPSGVTYAGFSVANIAEYFGFGTSKVGLAESEALIRASTNQAQTPYTQAALGLINPVRLKSGADTYNAGWGDIPWGLQHLAEHPSGSHYSGDFGKIVADIGRGFTALFTVGLSEIPIGDSRLGVEARVQPLVSTVLTGGAATSGAKNKLEENLFRYTGAVVATVAGGFAAFSGGGASAVSVTESGARGASGAVEFGPPSLETIPGGPVTFGPPNPSLIQIPSFFGQFAIKVTPFLLDTVKGLGVGAVFIGVQKLFGQAGVALTQLLTGDVNGLVRTIQGQPSQSTQSGQQAIPVGWYGGSAGGGGGFGQGGSSTTTMNPLLIIAGGGILLLLLYMLFRKK